MEIAQRKLLASLNLGKFSGTVLLLCLSGSLSLRAGPIFTIQQLGALGDGQAKASGINNAGQAVGWMTDAQGDMSALSFGNGQANALSGIGQANAINDSGLIAGTSYNLANTPAVTTWLNGRENVLSVNGYGTAVNGAGQIAGGYINGNGQLNAFTLTSGVLTNLGTLGGSWSSAYGINSAGETAGTSLTSQGVFHAFFSGGNALVDLGTLGGQNSYGMAVNANGAVVGNSQTSQGYANAFAWNGKSMTDLGTLGGTQSYANAVNQAGEVVGSSYASDGTLHGFVYSNGVMIDLNSLLPVSSGWMIDVAYSVNDRGDILAEATLGGQLYAVDLIRSSDTTQFAAAVVSTPEPGACALVGLGLIALAQLQRKRNS